MAKKYRDRSRYIRPKMGTHGYFGRVIGKLMPARDNLELLDLLVVLDNAPDTPGNLEQTS